MKNTFSEFYKPSPEEFEVLWNQSIFIFDTNTLLDLYRVSPKTAQTILDIMKVLKSKGQLWLPYQAGFEFHKHRKSIIEMEVNEYKRLSRYFTNKFKADALGSFMVNCNSHPLINKDRYLAQIEDLGKRIASNIDRTRKKHPDYSQNDPILDEVTELYEGCVGNKFTDERLKEIYKEGVDRYLKRIPPGYADANDKTEESEKYGDLVIWYEMIEKSQKSKKPIIFITRDDKEEWWYIKSGEKDGARKELIREMRQKAETQFYMYQTKNFISIASKKFNISLTQKSKVEINELRSIDPNINSNVSESLTNPPTNGGLVNTGTTSSDIINVDNRVKESTKK